MTNENDWVTQDVVPPRPDVDEFRWIKKDGTASSWLLTPEDYNGLISGAIVLESRLEVRCKRKDHPVLGKAESRMVSQDELNSAPKTRAWTFGTPAQTGHFLISRRDPALLPNEAYATSICSIPFGGGDVWFVYLGQTSDFVDPVVKKAKYTLLKHPNSPRAGWYSKPSMIQDKLDAGWTIVAEREFEMPEWDQ
tara:strand:+ start:1190 stop:1771 length:582 start_codon:yes stop_codon:yes gene_type:complete